MRMPSLDSGMLTGASLPSGATKLPEPWIRSKSSSVAELQTVQSTNTSAVALMNRSVPASSVGV